MRHEVQNLHLQHLLHWPSVTDKTLFFRQSIHHVVLFFSPAERNLAPILLEAGTLASSDTSIDLKMFSCTGIC